MLWIPLLLIEWFALAWTARLVRKSWPSPENTPRDFYWRIVRGMAWRILTLLLFPLPPLLFLVAVVTGEADIIQGAIVCVVMPIVLYPLFFLSVMWRAKGLVTARITALNAAEAPTVG